MYKIRPSMTVPENGVQYKLSLSPPSSTGQYHILVRASFFSPWWLATTAIAVCRSFRSVSLVAIDQVYNTSVVVRSIVQDSSTNPILCRRSTVLLLSFAIYCTAFILYQLERTTILLFQKRLHIDQARSTETAANHNNNTNRQRQQQTAATTA